MGGGTAIQDPDVRLRSLLEEALNAGRAAGIAAARAGVDVRSLPPRPDITSRLLALLQDQLGPMQAELIEDLVEAKAVREGVPVDGDNDGPVVCPYKGLGCFEAADAGYFFGRERLLAELVARLVGAPLLGIVGSSGSGKSSVTRAGLLPALACGVLPGSETWKQVLIRPGRHPLRELTDAIAAVGEGARVVVAVDQFEETFTTCEDEAERAAFIAELCRMAGADDRRFVVVIALRSHFYGRCSDYPELAGRLAANHVLVGSMRRDELRRAIEQPAQRRGLRVDPELVGALLADVKDEPGMLPLLSTVLLELWQRRESQRLRYTMYEQTGGVCGAVARLAEDAFRQLDGEQQILARSVLMRFVGQGADGVVERRRVALAELDTDGSEDVVVALLTDRRVLTVSSATTELTHEALLREWPRLRDWIDADRDGLRIHGHLSVAAREWQELGREEGALYRGVRLTTAAEWDDVQQPRLNETERAFLQASEARRRFEQTQHRRIRLILVGLSAAVVLNSAIAVSAIQHSREATRQRDITVSRALAASATTKLDVDPSVSVKLALRALAVADTEQAQNALRQATYASRALNVWPTHQGMIRGLSVSRDGRTVATGGDDGAIAIRSMETGRLLSTIKRHHVPVIGVALSPDGRRIVDTRDDGTVTISASDGRDPRTFLDLGHDTVEAYESPNYGVCVSFSDDGQRLAVGALDGTVRVLRADGAGGVTVLRGHSAQVTDVGFSPDGTRVISAASDGTVRVWDLQNGSVLGLAHPHARRATFSSDGRRIATAGDDGIVRLWRGDGSRSLWKIRVGQQPLLSVRFSRDGRRLVTSGADGVVRILDVRGGLVLEELKRHRGPATGAAFVAGAKVVSTGEDGTLRRWAPLNVAILRGAFVSASFSPDGSSVLTGDKDGRVTVYDISTGVRLSTIGPDTKLTTARYSPDGKRIITASLDGTVRVADPRNGRSRIVVRPDPMAPKKAADLDPSGGRIVSGGDNAQVIVQPVSGRGKTIALKGHGGGVNDVRFSPDGRHVLTASDDGTARIWNAATGKIERTLAGHRAPVNAARYSVNGKQIVTAGADGTVRVWQTQGGGHPVTLRGHEGAVSGAAFSLDGTRVVSAGVDGTIRVWDAAGGDTLVVLYKHRRAALSASFSPDGKTVLSTGKDRLARVSPCQVCGSMAEVRRLAGR
jgi:WD40 repeat protein